MATGPLRGLRGGELLDATATRSRRALTERLAELREAAPTLVLAALAAAVSWFIAQEALGHRQAFFAPVAAILTLGLTVGQRGRRAFEIGVGVALGIGVANLIVLAIGTGAWQLGVVVGLAMGAAILLGGGVLLVNQAAVSAVLVVTLQSAAGGLAGARFLDAVLGAAVALLANALMPSNPLRMVRREAEPLLAELAATLDEIADALVDHDAADANRALARARALDPQTARLREALDVGHETTVLAPSRRGARTGLAPYQIAVTEIDHAIRNTRVLARRARSSIEQDDRVPESAIAAIRGLAAAIPGLMATLADDDADREQLTADVIHAAALATAALEVTANLSANVIVGQVRSMAVDLLGAVGVERTEASEAVRGARQEMDA